MTSETSGRQAILLVDHGSMRPEANEMLERIAELVRERAPHDHVEVAHMELAPPTIAEGFTACVAAGACEVVVQPYMLAPGRHSTRDIPRLVAEAARKHPGVTFHVTEPLGVDPRLAELVLDRVAEARRRPRGEDPSVAGKRTAAVAPENDPEPET